jgi:hypothetical protein
MLRERGDVGEEAVAVLGASRGDQGIHIGLDGGEVVRVYAGRQQLGI